MKHYLKPIPALAFGLLCAATPSLSAATFTVDKGQSSITVAAKATGHSFTGTLKDYQIAAQCDPAANKPTALSLNWDFKDLDTDDAGRNAEMIKWLGGGSPKGSYKFVKIWSRGGTDYAEGTLTINGVGKTVQIPLTVAKNGNTVTAKGSATFKYTDFGLPLIRAMVVMTVDPELTVSFTLSGQAK